MNSGKKITPFTRQEIRDMVINEIVPVVTNAVKKVRNQSKRNIRNKLNKTLYNIGKSLGRLIIDVQQIRKCIEKIELPADFNDFENVKVDDSSDSESSCSLVADTKLKWILITGLEKSTTVDSVEAYLKKIWPGTEFDVEDMDIKGNVKPFKIGTDQLLYSDLLDPTKWPQGLRVDMLISFFRRRVTIII